MTSSMQWNTYTKRQGERIRDMREAMGLSQSDVANELGVRQPVVSRIENGHTCPTTRYLARIARILGCPTAQLLPDDED